MPSQEHTTCIAVHNNLANLSIAGEALERFCMAHGIARQILTQLQVALDEIGSNIIKYAWADAGPHEFSVRLTAANNFIELELIDDGCAFNPLSAPAPPAHADRRPEPGGVGIHMVRQLVDSIEYVRIDGRNHVIMKKRCAVAPHK